MDTAWTWELSGYCAKYSFLTEPKGLNIREVERIFQLDPEPPVHENLNDYIIKAVQSRNLRWFSFFLHHYENRLNGRVRRFLLREGLDRYDPERFLDYKMGCVLAMLDCLRGYNPAQGADFLTYAHHFIGNALLTCRMQEQAGSFENVDEYKAVRGIAWIYNQSGQSEQATIQKYAQKNGCTEETAKIIVDKKYTAGDADLLAAILETYNYKPSVQGGYDALKLSAEQLTEIGILKEGTDATKFADNAYIFFDDVPDAPESDTSTDTATESAKGASVSFQPAAAAAEEEDCCSGKITKPAQDTNAKA